jgi:ATP-binding cassette subfamily B protein
MQKIRQIFESVSSGVKCLILLSLIWFGSLLVLQGRLTTGEFVAFSMYSSQAVIPLLGLITLWDEVQCARASLARMQEILDEEPEGNPATQRERDATIYASSVGHCHSHPITHNSPRTVHGHIRFENVSFYYPGQEPVPVLEDLSFEIHPGEHVRIMGCSGSGKTTITRLLLGLYCPCSGRILIDGQDLAGIDLHWLRGQVGVVSQENVLFSGTIYDNISLGDPEPDMERVIEAARLAGGHEFITGLRLGYDTVVGELGLMLSGGQRQRIAIARALYHDHRIVILDEPTNALDEKCAEEVQVNLRRVLRGATTLIIGHDVPLAGQVDRLLVLQPPGHGGTCLNSSHGAPFQWYRSPAL